MPKPFDLNDLVARRARGENWDVIGAAYERTANAARLWWYRHRPAEPTADTSSSSSERPVSDDVDPGGEGFDPFSEPVRPAARVDVEQDDQAAAEAPSGSPLGEDAARAYLPLLFGAADALAQGAALWLLRRKLGQDASSELMDQARAIATLSPAERQALEASLVSRLATVRLTPDEALTLTVVGIYAAKAIGVMTLASSASSSPLLVVQGDPA